MGSLTCASSLRASLERLVVQQHRDRSTTSSHAACWRPLTLRQRPAAAAPPPHRRRHHRQLLVARAAPPDEPPSSLGAQQAPDEDSDREDIEVFATEAGVVEVVEADEAEVGFE